MGTISEKLTYLNDTKTLLKYGINSIGGNISNQTTFRDYATQLENIYQNLPKVSGSGTNINLSPTKIGRITSQINGDTQQNGTPTPDSPVEIQTVTGEQNVNIYGQQLFDYTDTRQVASEIIVDEDGWITATYDNSQGTETKYLQYYVDKMDLKVNTPYKIITEIKNASGTGNLNVVSTSTTNGQFITSISYQLDTLSAGDIKVDTATTRDSFPATSYGTRTVVRFNAGTSGSVTFRLTVMPNVEVTPETFVYEPYQGQNYKINLNNIELCKIGDYKDYIKKSTGKNLFSSEIELGSINNTTGANVTSNIAVRSKNYIEVKSSTTYTLSNDLGYYYYVYEYTEDNTFISYSSKTSGSPYTFTTTAMTKYIKLRTNATATQNNVNVKYQLEQGSTATEYEPYLPKGTWYIEKNIGKVVLNGSETWNYNDVNQVFVTPDLVEYLRSGFVPYSNYYQGQDVTQYNQLEANHISFLQSTTNNRLLIKNLNYTGVTAFKNWLSTHNTIVHYVLETPTYEEITNETLITQLENWYYAMSKNGQTNISVEGALPMILDVSVLKGE